MAPRRARARRALPADGEDARGRGAREQRRRRDRPRLRPRLQALRGAARGPPARDARRLQGRAADGAGPRPRRAREGRALALRRRVARSRPSSWRWSPAPSTGSRPTSTPADDLPSHADFYSIASIVLLVFAAVVGAELFCPDRRNGRDQPLPRPAAHARRTTPPRAGLALFTVMLAAAWLPQFVLLAGLVLGASDPAAYLGDNWLDIPRFLLAGARARALLRDARRARRLVHDAARLRGGVPGRRCSSSAPPWSASVDGRLSLGTGTLARAAQPPRRAALRQRPDLRRRADGRDDRGRAPARPRSRSPGTCSSIAARPACSVAALPAALGVSTSRRLDGGAR